MSESVLKILICDDSILMRKKLKDALKSYGSIEILEASDGQKAIDTYKENNPDLVFMDIVMPVKNGIEAVSEIKAYDGDAKIVMASSAGTKEHLKKALEAGAFEFIQKPWNQEHLSNIVGRFFEKGE